MAMWFDSSVPSSITKDTSNTISQVNDQSGNGYNVTSTGTLRPTYTPDDGDGLPTITFPLGTQLRNSTNTTMTEETFFAVMKYSTISGVDGMLAGRGASPNVSTTANTLNWTIAGSADGSTGLRNGRNPISGTYIILSGVRTSATDMYFGGTGNTGKNVMYENGAYLRRTTHTAGAATSSFLIARDLSNNQTAMSLREYIHYSKALTDTQRLNVEDFLNRKWHVYNNFPGRRNYNDGLQRFFTATGLTSPTASYPLIVISGQSNAGGEAQISLTSLPLGVQSVITNSLIYSPTTAGDFFPLQVGVNNQPDSAPSGTTVKHGTELSLMYDLVHDQSTTYVLKSFVGGTSLNDRWMPNLITTNNLWRTREDRVALAQYNAGYAGINLPVQADIWYQGEADAGAGGAYVTNYGTNEQIMVNDTRIFRGQTTPWISVKVRDVTEPSIGYDSVTAAKVSNSLILPQYQVIEGWTGQSPVGGPHGDSASMLSIGNAAAALLGATTHIP